jgi:hypothetical protein
MVVQEPFSRSSRPYICPTPPAGRQQYYLRYAAQHNGCVFTQVAYILVALACTENEAFRRPMSEICGETRVSRQLPPRSPDWMRSIDRA